MGSAQCSFRLDVAAGISRMSFVMHLDQTCAPRPSAALWRMQLTVARQSRQPVPALQHCRIALVSSGRQPDKAKHQLQCRLRAVLEADADRRRSRIEEVNARARISSSEPCSLDDPSIEGRGGPDSGLNIGA